MKRLLSVCLAIALCVVMSSQAQAVSVPFSEPDFDWLSQGGGTPNHIWVAGDFWQQNFVGTGLASADKMILDLLIDDNTLTSTAQDIEVKLNNVTVGNLTIGLGILGFQQFTFNFPAIAGPDFLVSLVATNTIPDGDGSVSISVDAQRIGRSGVELLNTAIPEPTTAVLGLLACLGLARRRRLA